MKNSTKNTMVMGGVVALVVMVGMAAMAGPASQKPRGFYISDNSTRTDDVSSVIVPYMRPINANVWQSNTVSKVGDYVKVYTNQNWDIYWCIVGGTSTNTAPTWSKLDDVTDGTVTWTLVDQSRSFMCIQNLGTSNVFLGFGWFPAADKGIMLGAGEKFILSREDPVFQGEVRALPITTTSNLVSVQLLP